MRHNKKKYYYVYTLPCFFLLSLLLQHAQANQQSDDLLNFLITQNQASQQKIKSYSYDLKSESELTRGSFSTSLKVKTKGKCLYCIYDYIGYNKTDDQTIKIEKRAVINDKYSAVWPMLGHAYAYQIDHNSIEEMSKDEISQAKINKTNDPLPHCFGDPTGSFSILFTQHPDVIKWDALKTSDPNGKTIYKIRRIRTSLNRPKRVDKIWFLDPEKGFLTTQTISYRSNGNVWMTRDIGLKEAVPGLWFPTSFNEIDYASSEETDQQAQTISRHVKMAINNLKVNLDIPNEQFEINALNLKQDFPDILVLRTTIDGQKTPYVYQGDSLIDQKTYQKELYSVPDKQDDLMKKLNAMDSDDLLQFILNQNSASRRKIKSYSYDLHTTRKSAFNNSTFIETAQVKKKGSFLWSAITATGLNKYNGKIEEIQRRLVVNNDYSAVWNNPGAYWIDHNSITIDNYEKYQMMMKLPFDPLPYCFGDKGISFTDFRTSHQYELKAYNSGMVDKNNKTQYQIILESSESKKIWCMDPEKGFLATQVITYKPDGSVSTVCDIGLEEVADGIWFPTSCNQKHYDNPKPPTQEEQTYTSCKNVVIENVKVNQDFPDEQFEINALNIKRDMPYASVQRMSANGKSTIYVYNGDTLVPARLPSRLRKPDQ